MRLLIFLIIGLLALTGCDTRQPDTVTNAQPPMTPATGDSLNAQPPEARAATDTTDYTRAHQANFDYSRADTLILLGKRHYWLQLRQVANSTKPLDYAPAYVVGRPFLQLVALGADFLVSGHQLLVDAVVLRVAQHQLPADEAVAPGRARRQRPQHQGRPPRSQRVPRA